MALACLSAIPPAASAATMKVVIVVGPVESMTSTYIYDARVLAKQARSYGAAVTEIYSPYATWSRVRSAAQGANLFIYLGHGNGWPSPYAPFNTKTKDGLGLNAASGSGNYNNKYYGEYYLINYIRLAPNAVVILNHLCYSAGNSESWQPNPTRTVAKQRIDNFGAACLRIGHCGPGGGLDDSPLPARPTIHRWPHGPVPLARAERGRTVHGHRRRVRTTMSPPDVASSSVAACPVDRGLSAAPVPALGRRLRSAGRRMVGRAARSALLARQPVRRGHQPPVAVTPVGMGNRPVSRRNDAAAAAGRRVHGGRTSLRDQCPLPGGPRDARVGLWDVRHRPVRAQPVRLQRLRSRPMALCLAVSVVRGRDRPHRPPDPRRLSRSTRSLVGRGAHPPRDALLRERPQLGAQDRGDRRRPEPADADRPRRAVRRPDRQGQPPSRRPDHPHDRPRAGTRRAPGRHPFRRPLPATLDRRGGSRHGAHGCLAALAGGPGVYLASGRHDRLAGGQPDGRRAVVARPVRD